MGLVGWWRKVALRAALRKISGRMAPQIIPLSAPRVYGRDYFTATMSFLDGRADVLVSGYSRSLIRGFAWNAAEELYQDSVELSLDDAVSAEFDFTYYLRQYEFRTNSPIRLWVGLVLPLYRFAAWRHDAAQGLFNRRTLQYRERMQVLQDLMAAEVERDSGFVNASTVVTARFGTRVVFHPSYRSRVRHTEFLLQSLVSEGLARQEKSPLAYRIAPAGFAALDAFNVEERRHADAQLTQRILVVIGLFALAASFVQAFAAVKQAWPSFL
ncbi:hypothetical protein LMG8323_03419 [Ralstonia mannitolilytica]|nr:hypothetical protein LMG8323_03419 [Ralstonia mannitolilytica]